MSLKYAEDMETGMVDMDRYTSFMSGKNMESVVDLHPVQNTYFDEVVLSGCHRWGNGGGEYRAQEMIVTPGSPVETVSFSVDVIHKQWRYDD